MHKTMTPEEDPLLAACKICGESLAEPALDDAPFFVLAEVRDDIVDLRRTPTVGDLEAVARLHGFASFDRLRAWAGEFITAFIDVCEDDARAFMIATALKSVTDPEEIRFILQAADDRK